VLFAAWKGVNEEGVYWSSAPAAAATPLNGSSAGADKK